MSEKITAEKARDEVETYYKKVRDASFQGVGTSETEVVDIISDYPWTSRSQFNKSGNGFSASAVAGGVNSSTGTKSTSHTIKNNIPYCYCIEREQVVSSTFMNMATTILQMNDAIANAQKIKATELGGVLADAANKLLEGVKTGKGLSKFWDFSSSALSGAINSDTSKAVSKAIQSLYGKIDSSLVLNNSQFNNGGSTLLSPYRLMYGTDLTGKYFVFPMLNGTDLLSISSTWGDKDDTASGSSLFNKIVSETSPGKVLATAANFSMSFLNMASFLEGANSNRAYHIDTGKFYQFSNQGDRLAVSFPLYNTNGRNLWKKNFQFLFLFAARNLPTKLSLTEYKVPLLYDIIIPGYKRYPVCFVQNLAVKPMGIIRTLPLKDFTNTNGSTWQVPVPESWEITINFESLIPPSMNLMMSALSDCPITIDDTPIAGAIATPEEVEKNNVEESTVNQQPQT